MRKLIILLAIIGSALAYAWHQDIGGGAHLSGFSGGIGGQFGTVAAAAPPAPYFDATFDNSGPSQLSDTLTVGSTTLDLALACDNPSTNISSGSWSCRKAGGTLSLTETGSGTSPDYVVGPWGDGWKFARTRTTSYNYFASSDASLETDAKDFVVELVYTNSTANAGCFGRKAGSKTTADKGWQIASSASSSDSANLYISDGTTLVTVNGTTTSAGGTSFGAIKHLLCFIGKSGASLAQCFNNGVSGGTAVSANALGATNTTTNLSLLREATASGRTCTVASARIWTCTSCLTNATDYVDIAKDRTNRLMGIRPSVFAGTAIVEANTRATSAYHRTYDSVSDSTVYSLVGSSWMRAERRKIGASTVNGFLAEPSATNACLQANQIDNAAWTKTGGTATGGTTDGPSTEVTSTADTFSVTSTGTAEVIQARTVSASNTYTFSTHFKRVDSSSPQWVALTPTNVATCSANQTLLAWFDITNCATGNLGTDALRSEATNMGNGWCRVQATFTSSATATSCDLGFRVVDSNGGTSWTGGTSGVSLYHWTAQWEAQPRATTPINTTSASAARNLDELRFNNSNITSLGASDITIDLGMNCPQRATLSAAVDFLDIGDGTSTNRYLLISDNTPFTKVRMFSSATGSSANVDMNSTTSWATDAISVRGTWTASVANLYINGTVEATDNSPTLISSWSTGHFRVGNRITGATTGPQCTFDRIRIWDSAVSPSVAP